MSMLVLFVLVGSAALTAAAAKHGGSGAAYGGDAFLSADEGLLQSVNEVQRMPAGTRCDQRCQQAKAGCARPCTQSLVRSHAGVPGGNRRINTGEVASPERRTPGRVQHAAAGMPQPARCE